MRKIFGILSVGAFLLLSSCEHKELCYNHTHNAEVKVVFDWANDPTANPESMDIYFIPEEGGSPQRYQFGGKHGGTIQVPLGRYHVIGINSDSETNLIAGADKWENFEIRTVNTSLLSFLGVRGTEPPRADGTEDERVVHAPDKLWHAADTDHHLDDPTKSYVITLYPENGLCNYTVKVINVTNLKYATNLSGSLSSMAGGLKAAMCELTTDRVTVSFSSDSDQESVISSRFRVFGHCPSLNDPHQLTIYAVVADGSKFYKTFDVTEQIHTAADPRNIEILIDGLELPKPIINGGGFNPDVSEWGEGEDVEIQM